MHAPLYPRIKVPQPQQVSETHNSVQKKTPVLQPKSSRLPDSLRNGLANMHTGIQPDMAGKGVVQRQINWVDGGRQYNRNMADPLIQFTDFGITPVILNNIEIPGPGDVSKAITGPAFLIEKTEDNNIKLSVHNEAVNRVGYRMELPSAPPWQKTTSIGNANVRLQNQGFSISDSMIPRSDEKDEEGKYKPDNEAQILIDAHGLPKDATFAKLVEHHENIHLNDLTKILRNTLSPWDRRISMFKEKDMSVTAGNVQEAQEKFYKMIGGTPATKGEEFKHELIKHSNFYHHSKEGSSPQIETTSFANNILRVYWKHPLG